MPAPDSAAALREERRAHNRARVLEEASRLFAERGFVGTTIEAIAERLGSSKPFIYQFFDNKHAILVALYDHELRESLGFLYDVVDHSGSPLQRLERFVELAVRKNVRNQALTDVFAQEEKQLPPEKLAEIRELEAQFNHALTHIVQAGVDSGEFNVGDVAIAARCVMGMLQWIKRWYRPTGPLGVVEVTGQLQDYAQRLVGAPEARAAPEPSKGKGMGKEKTRIGATPLARKSTKR